MLHLSDRGYAAWGFGFRFESTDELLRDVVSRCYRDLPPATGPVHVLRAVQPGADRRFDLTIEAPDGTVERCGDGRTGAAVLELVCWEVNRRATGSVATRAALHAAVIGGPLGAVALCATSHSGKSTLAAAAARRGWHHLSDDMGLLDVEAMTVIPYARPIMLRPGGRDRLGGPPRPPAPHMEFMADEWFLPASELGAVVSPEPRPLVAVGFLEWRDAAALEPLSRARTLHDLLLHSATAAMQGAEGFSQLERVARVVPGLRVGLGAPDDVLDLLAPLVGYPDQRHV